MRFTPTVFQGSIADRPQADTMHGSTFVAVDTGEVFICEGSRWVPMSQPAWTPRRMICENCGGPHESHEKRCSWCRRLL